MDNLLANKKTASFIGAALLSHLSANALFKLLSSTSLGHKLESKAIQAGISHAAAGKQLHPILNDLIQGGIGPEAMMPYQLGHQLGQQLQGISAGQQRKQFKKLLYNLKKVPNTTEAPVLNSLAPALNDLVARKSDWTKSVPSQLIGQKATIGNRALTLGVGGVISAVAPDASAHLALNSLRRVIGDSAIGKRFMKNQFTNAVQGKPLNRALESLQTYGISPGSTYPNQIGKAIAADYTKNPALIIEAIADTGLSARTLPKPRNYALSYLAKLQGNP